MEQTLLEKTLEEFLPKIGMKLGSRVYADDKDFQAELEDVINPMSQLKPNVSFIERLQHYIEIYRGHSPEQIHKGEQYLIERRSTIFNGLGFTYILCTDPPILKKELEDSVIKERDFGELGAEYLDIYFNMDEIWQSSTISPRSQAQIANRFYNDIENKRLMLGVLPDYEIEIWNSAKKEGYDNCQQIRGPLEAIEKDFDGKKLNENNIQELMQYLRELKENI